MTFKDDVLAVLPVDGITPKELEEIIGKDYHGVLSETLRKLEAEGKAARGPAPKPVGKARRNVDLQRAAKVQWRRIE